jgi:hypothetical protein
MSTHNRVRKRLVGRVLDIAARKAPHYNAATFFSTKHAGPRTSKIVDPPNGRLARGAEGGRFPPMFQSRGLKRLGLALLSMLPASLDIYLPQS